MRNLGYFFVAKEVTKKASLAAMAGFVATRGRVLQFYQNSRAFDLMVTLAGRKEPPGPRPCRVWFCDGFGGFGVRLAWLIVAESNSHGTGASMSQHFSHQVEANLR